MSTTQVNASQFDDTTIKIDMKVIVKLLSFYYHKKVVFFILLKLIL